MTLPTARWRSLIAEACAYAKGVPEDVFEAMVLVESNGDPNARSRSDARGLSQQMPRWHTDLGLKVARDLGVTLTDGLWYEPRFNLFCGARHLAWCRQECGTWETAVAKYHSGQCHPPANFVDGQGTSTVKHLEKFRAALIQVRANRDADTPAGDGTGGPTNGGGKMAEHRYGIGMGHRNINYGGAWGEYDWTPGCARALKAAIEARGGDAHLFQEHDGDSDPNFSTGKGLQAAARVGSDTIVNRFGPLTAIFFCHYNSGGGRGAHFIYPDGWVAPDRGVDNPLDIQLAAAIKKHLARTNTVGFLHWGGWLGPEPGVMSERNTGAVSGRYGYRLGELVGTIQHRSVTPRLIIEAGSIDTNDRTYITNPAWVRHVYAEAICDALEEVFGPMPKPKPVEPEKPESVYVTPIERKWADEAIAAGVPFVDLPDRNHPAGRTRWWRVDRNYMTIDEVARQQVATDTSKFLNEPIPPHTPIWVDFAGENYEDEAYGLTPWGTMVRMDNLRVIDWPDQPDLHAVDVEQVVEVVTGIVDEHTA